MTNSFVPGEKTGQQAIIKHQQLSDTVVLYGVFLHTRESRQFRRGKGYRSKSQNTKKETSRWPINSHAYLKQRQ